MTTLTRLESALAHLARRPCHHPDCGPCSFTRSFAAADARAVRAAVRWNCDKPHRCPSCHAVAVDMDPHPTSWWVYTCCRCGVRFTRWPRLARLLPKAGVRCSEHSGPDAICGGENDDAVCELEPGHHGMHREDTLTWPRA